ncbi:MAG: hypothetical protein JSR77_18400 [Planctomycetes bacterium]|nr:hypothetical protein [Planctomycetota bacterium]
MGLAAGASVAFHAPRVLADDKSGLKNPVLGSGDHKYECIHDWLTPPEGLAWGDTHGLAQDAAGLIYVAHTVNASSKKSEAVVVYDASGKFQTAWGDSFRGGAHGLDIRSEAGAEFLYHCDTRRRLMVKTDLTGRVVWEQGYPKESNVYEAAEKFCPTNVAFVPAKDGRGDVLLGDGYGSSYVHRYSCDGVYLKTIIKPGKDKGQVSCPHGLWVDERDGTPRLAVADRGNRRIQYFTLEGEHTGFVTDGIRMPCHFKTRNGVMLVPDLESVVTLLDKDNKVIVHLGDGHPSGLRDKPRSEFISGKFIHPHTAIFLANGDILVAEWVPIGRITLLRHVA